MAARNWFFARPWILDADAGTLSNPLFDLGATFIGKAWINRRAAGKALLVLLQNLQNLRVVLIRGKGLFQCPPDFLRNGPLDAHALDKKTVSLVLLDGVFRHETMKVIVPNSVGNKFLSRRKSVFGRIDEELARVHSVPSLIEKTISMAEDSFAGALDIAANRKASRTGVWET